MRTSEGRTQYLIRFETGALKGETDWAVLEGDDFVRGSCIGRLIHHHKDEVTVIDTRRIDW